jgi:hypothetical protein
VRSPGVFLSISPNKTRYAVLFFPLYSTVQYQHESQAILPYTVAEDIRPACSLTVCEQRHGLTTHRVVNDGKRTGLVFTNEGQSGGNVHTDRPSAKSIGTAPSLHTAARRYC